MSNLITVNNIVYDPSLPKALVLFRYDATEDEELSLVEGQMIDILEEASDGWWSGASLTKEKPQGIFPFNYCRKVSDEEFQLYLKTGTTSSTKPTHNNSNNNDSNNQSASSHQLQHHSQELHSDHLIASLSDPYMKRASTGSTPTSPSGSSIGFNNNNNNNNTNTNTNNTNNNQPVSITIRLDDVAKEGYLIKKGHIRRNWNVRWFVLKRNILTYAKTPKEAKINELILTPDTEIDIATSMKRANCFQIKIPIDKSKDRYTVFYCSSASPDDMESWITSLNQAKLTR